MRYVGLPAIRSTKIRSQLKVEHVTYEELNIVEMDLLSFKFIFSSEMD